MRHLPKLFSSDVDGHNNAWVNYRYHGQVICLYAEGYERAAKILIEHVKKGRQRDNDLLIYPIVFLYRQHLELRLKEIINEGRKLLKKSENGYPKHHKLDRLWPTAKGIIRQVWSHLSDPKEFDLIAHVIQQFTQYDPQSMNFRYPDQDAAHEDIATLDVINIRQFGDVMDKVSYFLDGVSIGISEHLDSIQSARQDEQYYLDS